MIGLDWLHVDKVTVTRAVQVTAENGMAEEKKVIVGADLRCRLHQKSLRAPGEGDDARSYQTYTLYASDSLDIQQNDTLAITTSQGEKYRFRASKPFRYPLTNHLEIALEAISTGGWP